MSLAKKSKPGGDLSALLKERLYDCARAITDPLHTCRRQEIYQDITGNPGAPQPADVAIPKAFRTAFFHVVAGAWDTDRMATYYALGPNSYLSESAYDMGGGGAWKPRLWGENYGHLLQIKRKWDPKGVFWCHHCIGDDD